MHPPMSRSTVSRPTSAQIEAYRREGFVVVEQFLDQAELSALRNRFAACFAHEWETGLAPDEVNYVPGETAPDRTRQLCNLWKADRTVAATTLSERNGRWGAALAGAPGMRLVQDNAIWKPPRGRALLCHQDAAYVEWLEPSEMTTCWMALDATHADTGTIYYVRGSHHWPRTAAEGVFHAPDDWLTHAEASRPPDTPLELVPIEVPAGGAAFHDGWTFHGSPVNERADRDRRALVSHMVSTETRWRPGAPPHPQYGRYRRPGERELDDAFFPVLWGQDGGRTPAIDSVFARLSAGRSSAADT
jgi:ectoine hydroxylase-related dioxygenase (phytanoyl-CoA dioxygenase family)